MEIQKIRVHHDSLGPFEFVWVAKSPLRVGPF